MNSRVRPLVVPAFATLVVAAILVGLGVWQLQRLAWKDALIAQVEARSKAPPQPLPPPATWEALKPSAYEFQHVSADGRFDNKEETLILRASADGPGYHVVTPLHLVGGGTVLVDRGFVPATMKDPATRKGGEIEGLVHVVGLMRAPEPRNLFTPADDAARGLFYTRDPGAIAAHWKIADAAPFSIDAETGASLPGTWPKAGLAELAIPNNHFSYAMTWFGLALGLIGVFISYAWQRIFSGPADGSLPGAKPARH